LFYLVSSASLRAFDREEDICYGRERFEEDSATKYRAQFFYRNTERIMPMVQCDAGRVAICRCHRLRA
jgi:hypothetical protein